MDESALRNQLHNLEALRSSLHSSFRFWEWMVVLGLIIDAVVILKEFWDDWKDFQHGIVHPPERPRLSLLVLALLGTGLIAFGISKELAIDSRIEGVETQIRGVSEQLFGVVSQEAENAEKKSEAAGTKADEIQGRLDSASRQLGAIEAQVRMQGPRRRLLEDNRDKFLQALKPFAGQRVTVLKCGVAIVAEPEQLEQYLLNLLGVSKASKPNAGWAVESPGYATWAMCNTGASSAGGNLVITSASATGPVKSAAKALYDALNDIDISTIKAEAANDQHALTFFDATLGADSPWSLAARDPTAVLILVGSNPMFGLPGWHKRHKRTVRP